MLDSSPCRSEAQEVTSSLSSGTLCVYLVMLVSFAAHLCQSPSIVVQYASLLFALPSCTQSQEGVPWYSNGEAQVLPEERKEGVAASLFW